MLSKIWLLTIVLRLINMSLADDLIPSNGAPLFKGKRPDQCIRVQIELCKDIGYNFTYLPNLLNHATQEEASTQLNHFKPLIGIKCDENLRLFLCGIYAPICVETWKDKLPPCKSLCIKARDSCSPYMKDFQYKWPEQFDCDSLPDDDGKNKICLKKTRNSYSDSTDLDSSATETLLSKNSMSPMSPTDQRNNQKKKGSFDEIKKLKCTCECRPPLILDSTHYLHVNSVMTGKIPNCLLNCYSPYFQNIDQSFPTFWLGLWSSLCVVSTSITLFTFLIKRSRFQYPERPIVFLSLCYFFVAIGYLVRVFEGHKKIACKGNILRYNSSGAVSCSLVFLLTYFFGTAAAMWWVILAFTWFLAASMKWSSEAITTYADVFHFLGWLLPGILSILALTLSAVDGDPISGICSVGNTNQLNLLVFSLIPHGCLLVIGIGFLMAGFFALIRIRRVIIESNSSNFNQLTEYTNTELGIKHGSTITTLTNNNHHHHHHQQYPRNYQNSSSTTNNNNTNQNQITTQKKTERLERLMIRIGVFGAIYAVPGLTIVLIRVYELVMRDRWERIFVCNGCMPKKAEGFAKFLSVKPEYAVFMLKYFMELIVGTASGFWIWTPKTIDTWTRLFKKTICICYDSSYIGNDYPNSKQLPKLPNTNCATVLIPQSHNKGVLLSNNAITNTKPNDSINLSNKASLLLESGNTSSYNITNSNNNGTISVGRSITRSSLTMPHKPPTMTACEQKQSQPLPPIHTTANIQSPITANNTIATSNINSKCSAPLSNSVGNQLISLSHL